MSAGRFNLSALAVRERAVTLFLIGLISLAGLVAFFKLGRAEDPAFTIKIMTVVTILAGLVPIMFSTGAGADVMKRIAAPMIGGVITSTVLELLIYPAIFYLWRSRALLSGGNDMKAG